METDFTKYLDVMPSGLQEVVASLSHRKDAVTCLERYLTRLREQNRQDLGFDRIWDCGLEKWVLDIT